MNSITFSNTLMFVIAVNTLALESAPEYTVDNASLTISSEDVSSIAAILNDNGITNFTHNAVETDDEHDNFRNDVEADADALASAGFGSDEDYEHCSYDEGDY